MKKLKFIAIVYFSLFLFSNIIAQTNSKKAEEFLKKGKKLYKNEDYSKADIILNKSISISSNPETYYYLALTKQKLDSFCSYCRYLEIAATSNYQNSSELYLKDCIKKDTIYYTNSSDNQKKFYIEKTTYNYKNKTDRKFCIKNTKNDSLDFYFLEDKYYDSIYKNSDPKYFPDFDTIVNKNISTCKNIEMPEFYGGEDERIKFISNNIIYPNKAKISHISGTVFVNFVINEDGKVVNEKIIKEIGWGCDEEALRIVRLMPKWKPGTMRGKLCRISYNLPIKFTLNNEPHEKSETDKLNDIIYKYNLPINYLIDLDDITEIDKAKDLMERGVELFNNANYKAADSLFNLSLKLYSNKDIYFNLALVRNKFNDYCGLCKNLILSSDYGDIDSRKQYNKKCIQSDTIFFNSNNENKKSKLIKTFQKFDNKYIYSFQTEKTLDNKYEFFVLKTSYSDLLYNSNNPKSFPDIDTIANENIEMVSSGYLDKLAEFNGGEVERIKFINNTIIYPNNAKNIEISGTVFLSFEVDINGNLKNIKIEKGIGGGCDEEAIRVVKNMPRWKPGIRKGKPIASCYTLPIKFVLN